MRISSLVQIAKLVPSNPARTARKAATVRDHVEILKAVVVFGLRRCHGPIPVSLWVTRLKHPKASRCPATVSDTTLTLCMSNWDRTKSITLAYTPVTTTWTTSGLIVAASTKIVARSRVRLSTRCSSGMPLRGSVTCTWRIAVGVQMQTAPTRSSRLVTVLQAVRNSLRLLNAMA